MDQRDEAADDRDAAAKDLRATVGDLEGAAGRLAEALRQFPPSRTVTGARDDVGSLREALPRIRKAVQVLAREREAWRALFEVGRDVNSTLDLGEVLDSVMDRIIELTGADRSFLMLVHEDTGELEFKAARNVDRETIDSSAFQVSRTVVHNVFRDGEPVLTMNAREDPRFAHKTSVLAGDLRSILCVPLRARDRTTGVIYADNRVLSGVFAAHDLDLLAAFANQAAVAIENARLFERVSENLATITEMKGLMDDVFSSMASAVVTMDADHRVQLVNRAAERVFGISGEEVVGRAYDEVLLGASHLAPLIREVLAEDRILTQEMTHSLPDRGSVSWRASLSPLKDASQETRGVTLVVDDLTEQRFVRETFGRYVGPRVVQRLLSDASMLRLGGERRRITILFGDIRGFTAFSEKLEPERLVEILNVYLGLAADAVMNEEGTLDKFMGDAVMGLFNAPLEQPHPTLSAVRAAVAMQRAIGEQHPREAPGERLSFGVGIHVGDAVVGNLGSVRQQNYTAVGDSVNYAKRLQENARAGQVLVSRAAYAEVRDAVRASELPPMAVKGRSVPEPVYEIQGLR